MRRSERLLHGKAVRWSPKLRVADVLEMCCQAEDGQGKPVLDEKGEERRGVEAPASDSPRVDEYPERMNGTEIASASQVATPSQGLFTLDNRRLYVLQRAAVYHYPRWGRLSHALFLAGSARSPWRLSPTDGK